MTRNWSIFGSSVTAKLGVIAAIMLLLLVPLTMTEQLIRERGGARAGAALDVAAAWGAAQTLGGPVIVVPFRHTVRDRQGVTRRVEDEIYLLPSELAIEASAETQSLNRGIYRIPVYTAQVAMTGRLRAIRPDATTHTDPEVLWQAGKVLLPLADPRALRSTVTLMLGDTAIKFGPGDGDPWLGPVLSASLDGVDPARFESEQPFSLDLAVAGTGQLHFRPDGDLTRVTLASDWPSPSFRGAYLPDSRLVTDSGFDAEWRVLATGRGYAATWLDSARAGSPAHPASLLPAIDPVFPAVPGQAAGGLSAGPLAASSFGVEYLVPVDVHTSGLRAIKYAELYLAVTFAAFFLFEVFTGTRLHPIQYLAVGLANGIFYVLLLALAEHAGFGPAYGASATASTALIGGYAAAILGSTRRALPVTGLLAGLYAYLYTTLRAEDYALLAGALGLFMLLTAFMYLTRHIDWYGVELAGTAVDAGPRSDSGV